MKQELCNSLAVLRESLEELAQNIMKLRQRRMDENISESQSFTRDINELQEKNQHLEQAVLFESDKLRRATVEVARLKSSLEDGLK